MPVIVRGAAVLVREIFPLVVLVALNEVTVFALPSVVPPTELVVSNAAVKTLPAPASDTVPAEPVKETFPVVVILPAFNVTAWPAVALIAPDVLPTSALNKISLEPPVAESVTVPEPPAVTVEPKVSVPPVAVKLIVPFEAVEIAPLVVNAPVFVTAILPLPV